MAAWDINTSKHGHRPECSENSLFYSLGRWSTTDIGANPHRYNDFVEFRHLSHVNPETFVSTHAYETIRSNR